MRDHVKRSSKACRPFPVGRGWEWGAGLAPHGPPVGVVEDEAEEEALEEEALVRDPEQLPGVLEGRLEPSRRLPESQP